MRRRTLLLQVDKYFCEECVNIATRSECGGFRCTRAAGSSRPQKCVVADRFMQCVYQRIDSQVTHHSHQSVLRLLLTC